ncbi:MAG: copper resistance protein B, partial [Cupriavidus sp.]|nr:copper resistance protein B [Cupriavidus sp.]
MYKYTRIAVAALLTAGMSAAWAQHSHSPNSSNNDGAPANEATPDSRPQKATAPTAKKQGSTPSAGQGSMQGMDHSKMQGMDQGSMQGMDHSKMQGMDQGSMQGMDHSKMQGMDQGSMQGMDHSKMQGMDQGSMQGMDHGAMQMQGGSAPPDARDPDAYSDGAKLGVGQYAIGPSRSLHMADEHIFASVLVD